MILLKKVIKQADDLIDTVTEKSDWELVHEFVEKFGRIPKDEDELNSLVYYVLKRRINSKFSKDDTTRINEIIETLNIVQANRVRTQRMHYNKATIDKNIDWLKSLKERIQPQPNQEWKQENTGDLTDFENAMMHIGGSFFGQYAGLDPNDTNAIKEQANLLLKLVPSKEWSKEDEKILNSILSCIEYCKDEDTEAQYDGNIFVNPKRYEPMIDWLKSLRPQKQWNEEDETGLTNTIIMLKEGASLYFTKDSITKVIDWLKSLKQRIGG